MAQLPKSYIALFQYFMFHFFTLKRGPNDYAKLAIICELYI